MYPYQFLQADLEDDQALRKRLNDDTIKGKISLSFRREPSYFTHLKNIASIIQVIKCVKDKKIVGTATRAILKCQMRGSISSIGYLSDLRIENKHRSGWLLSNGFKYLRELHLQSPVPFYYTLIWESNYRAIKSLEGKRGKLPEYIYCSKILSPIIFLRKKKKIKLTKNLHFKRASTQTIKKVITFINNENKNKELSPYINLEGLLSNDYQNLRADDFYYLQDGQDIVAAISLWDQCSYRQTFIETFSFKYKLIAKLFKFCHLGVFPKENTEVKYVFGSFMTIKKDNLILAKTLLKYFNNELIERGYDKLVLSINNKSILKKLLKSFIHLKLAGNLYFVFFDTTIKEEYKKLLDSNNIYIELGLI